MNSQNFDSKYLETVTDTRLDPGEHLVAGATGFRLTPSGLTLDYLEELKINAKK